MNLQESTIVKLYEEISNKDSEALEFIKLWSVYCHKFDDLVDEEFNVEKLVECNNEMIRLLSSKFFQKNKEFLISQIYIAAWNYKHSEDLKFSSRYEERLLAQYLSHEGNNMLLTVALITGGYDLMKKVAPKILNLTYVEHPLNVGEV